MLTITKNITLNGVTEIDGTVVERHQAVINSERPEDMTLNVGIKINKSLSEANLTLCRSERNEFEDAAIALKNELVAGLESTEE